MRHSPHACAALAALALGFAAPRAARAQRPDSAKATVPAPAPAAARRAASPADTARPPITPRRAFLYSFLVPGSAQSILGRNKTAALLLAFEGAAIAMIRESGADVHEAQRISSDSVLVDWSAPGQPGTRAPGPLTPRGQGGNFVRSRRSHLEDWIAVLVANHLFSGADAYVAANLWDLPTQLSVRPLPDGRVAVVATVSW